MPRNLQIGVEDSILGERRSGQDGIDSCFHNLAESSSDENGKLECEPTAYLSTGIWRGCSLKRGYTVLGSFAFKFIGNDYCLFREIKKFIWRCRKRRSKTRTQRRCMAKNSGRGARETAAAISYLRNKHGD